VFYFTLDHIDLTPEWFGFVVRFSVDPPLHAIYEDMAQRRGDLCCVKFTGTTKNRYTNKHDP
jgi:hypothetical protein